ncbi:MT-A70 family methyltransferase [Rahnella sp. RcJ3]|uniref:MT-A70 family methyltransferase n=1 Tax=Rahnella sp. RcJ3 TaxID=2292446 RepID=UPI001294DB66|nr:MT-A70 family methyltransferase [Rahnella sp. RcJ3]MQB55035.1 adenine methyltransferase [Rahnella sp. RcJ3]
MSYQLIYADPAWQYSNKVSNGAAGDHYSTMPTEEMKRLPVWSIADENAILAMWYTGNFASEAVELAQAWGFKVKTMKAFTWVKLYEQARGRIERALADQTMLDFEDFLDALSTETVMNGGNYTRGNSEDVLIATRGAGLERLSASVKQVVYSCRGEHSEKPAEVRFRLEELYGQVSRIELFSRGEAAGWHHWGNETPFNDIELVPATFTTIPPARNSRVKVLAGHYLAVPAGALQHIQQQNIPEIIPVPETNNRVWPAEVNHLFDQVAESSNLDAHLQNKLRHHINRLKMDGMPVDQIIDTAGTLARKMGATA